MNMHTKLTVPPSVIFSTLVRRAAAGLAHVRWGQCTRCERQTPHTLAAETVTTNEVIWRCPDCGSQRVL